MRVLNTVLLLGAALGAGIFGGEAAAQGQGALGRAAFETPPTGLSVACVNCHGGQVGIPGTSLSQGVDWLVIARAIETNLGGMGVFRDRLADKTLQDIAVYIAVPESGSQPYVTVNAPSFTIGPVPVGQTGRVQVTVNSIGAGPVTGMFISASGVNLTAAASAQSPCGLVNGSIAAGSSCNVDLVFAPTQAGVSEGRLTINSNAFNGLLSRTVRLSTAAAPVVPPPPTSPTPPPAAATPTNQSGGAGSASLAVLTLLGAAAFVRRRKACTSSRHAGFAALQANASVCSIIRMLHSPRRFPGSRTVPSCSLAAQSSPKAS